MNLKSKIKEYCELVKFEHSIFALPFVISGMLLAFPEEWPESLTYLWVVLAMIGGRTAAMALNRIIDRNIDRQNPRTKDRALPAGRIKVSHAIVLTILSLLVMTLAVLQLPVICIYLLPAAYFIIYIYSYTKRFTILSHYILGFVLGSAAIGGWIAVSGNITLPSVLFGAAVTFWVAGFDIIYSTQDIDFDREHNLHSIPARFGVKKALLTSQISHILTIILFIFIGLMLPYFSIYWFGVAFISVMLAYEHSLLSPTDLSKVNMAFFNINGLISIGFLFFVLADKLMM